MAKQQQQEIDPFIDDSLGVPLDLRTGPQHIAELGQIAEDHPEFAPTPEQIQAADGIPLPPEPEPTLEPSPDLDDQPEVYDLDGGQVVIEKTGNGWKATLKGKRTEVFKGKTKSELMTNVLAGKLAASKQIDKLNKELKLGRVAPSQTPTTPVRTPAIQPKVLTAEEVFQIKTALADNPDLALEKWFQAKFGKSASELMLLVEKAHNDAQKGVEANEELTVEGVSKEFLAANDDYYVCPENSSNLMYWLCVHKLRRQPTNQDGFGTISAELVANNLYTVDNLTEAWEDLKDDELAVFEPDTEEVEPTPAPVVRRPAPKVTVPVQPAPRITEAGRNTRGGLGIRPGSVTAPQPNPQDERAPSVDELENLSNEQLFELKAKADRFRYQQKYGSARR